ncbi:metal ABC transporter substrate-binding protein [Ligilactobacillus sp. LYQ112]|uniref:metal ABC transporter substrate-binding protein n=1 Tax=Ligilactobacillus sp. LYQ112 TaxID=3391060 RepID=UPI0039836E06
MMRWHRWWVAIIALLTLGVTWSTTPQRVVAASTHRLQVVTTFYPVYDFTKAVVGNRADVSVLIPAGTEPHDFEPTAREVARMSRADMVIYTTKYMAPWIDALRPSLRDDHTTLVAAGKGIPLINTRDEMNAQDALLVQEHQQEAGYFGGGGAKDPHIWLDPVNAVAMVRNIERGVCQKDPGNAAYYRRNARHYIRQLYGLDRKYRRAFKGCHSRTFITQHAAFGYLARRYGLHQITIAGISDNEEPSPQRLALLHQYIRRTHTPVLFAEADASQKIARVLAHDTQVQVRPLNPLESLTTTEIRHGANYLTVMRINLQELKHAIH